MDYDILKKFKDNHIDKATYIKLMYEHSHAALFKYQQHLKKTNIRKIELVDDGIIATTRNFGTRFLCPINDFRSAPIEILNFGDYEKSEFDMVSKLLTDGEIFFDIGANIGWYSINIAATRKKTKVHSFEPIPVTFEFLKKNIAHNLLSNISINNFGLSNAEADVEFYYYPEGSGNASAKNLSERADAEILTCKVRTLDNYMLETGEKVDFIKCDVEGAELLAFKGGIKTISKDKPIIFAEILRKWTSRFDYNSNHILDLLKQYGYQSFVIKNGKLASISTIDDQTVETNFFFLHAEKHAEKIKDVTC